MRLGLCIASLLWFHVDGAEAVFVRKDVCILGGGASGSFTAWQLQKRGYDVVLVEPRDQLGGNCNEHLTPSATNADVTYITHVGVSLYAGVDFVTEFFDEMEQTSIPNYFGSGPIALASTGSVFPPPACDALCQAILNNAILSYATIMSTPPYVGPDGTSLCSGGLIPDFAQLDDATQAAYFQTFGEFLSENPELDPILSLLIGFGQGFGPAGFVPMWEFCLIAPPLYLQRFLTQQFRILPNGCQAVYDSLQSKMLQQDPTSVRLNTSVLRIRRRKWGSGSNKNRIWVKVISKDDESTEIFHHHDGKKRRGRITWYDCGSTFIAFRPLGIQDILMDMTPEEETFFGNVGYPNRAYISSVWRMTPNAALRATIDASLVPGTELVINFADASLTEPGFASSLIRYGLELEHEDRPFSLLYNYVDADASQAELDAIALEMETTLELMGFENITQDVFVVHPYGVRPISDENVIDFYGFANRANFNDDDNLFWIGATYSGEASERVWEHALRILNAKFPSRR